MITRFVHPTSEEEALRIQKETPNAVFIAGGTHLLSPAFRDRPMAAVSIEGLLPREIRASAELLSIGALATLQELVESGGGAALDGARVSAGAAGSTAAARGSTAGAAGAAAPAAGVELALLGDAAASMGNRNVRNRATVGGNVAANKPSACLAPALLALDARLLLAGGARRTMADYLAAPGALIEAVEIPLVRGRAAAYRRWARTEGDISAVAVAVALRLSGSVVAEVRVGATGVRAAAAAGSAGMGSTHARAATAAAAGRGPAGVGTAASSEALPGAGRLAAVEALFEGSALLRRAEIERAVLPLLDATSDIRASAAYRRLRAAQLIADALLAAAAKAAGLAGAAGGARPGDPHAGSARNPGNPDERGRTKESTR